MQIHNQTNDPGIETARLLVIKHFKDFVFLNRISMIPRFNHTVDNGMNVADKIKAFKGTIYLRHYSPVYRFSKAVAYAEKPNIYFNAYKNMQWIDRVETIAHEILHFLNYSHRGNYVNEYNNLTAPYVVAKIFKDYISEIYGKKETQQVCYRSFKTLWLKEYCYEKEVIVFA